MKFIGVYITCFLIFCAWRFYEQRKSERLDKKASDDFWAREEEANHTRKKDISHLPLLEVKESEIPMSDSSDESILYYIDHIREIIKMPMIDLSEYSNTDLKLAYGVANFNILSEYDENYNTFLLTLSNLARSYSRADLYKEAKACYELALYYGSKKRSDYTDLAEVYLKLDTPELITTLVRQLEEGCHPRKASLIEAVEEVRAHYKSE